MWEDEHAYYYARVALCAADLGTDDGASRPATWTQEPKDAWADFRLSRNGGETVLVTAQSA